ncbi:MAG: tRNA uridine-5-carboxymethylaminomethyl(34) synthesis enzyme MnmG [Phycisphaerales bacterium JB063]
MKRENAIEVLVIGGGHAGAEAAWSASSVLMPRFLASGGRSGRVGLVTMDPRKTGAMSCNPAIGGLAKGQIVREIDALGGLMGLAADATGIQFRVLNASRGAAVHGPRCQSDKYAYAREVQRLLASRPNIQTLPGLVEDFLVEDGRCVGVLYKASPIDGPAVPSDGCCGEFGAIDHADKAIPLHAKAVVLTTGTFMRAIMHKGADQTPGGRVGEGTADGISGALKRQGFELGRLKTGTPPRLKRDSLVVEGLELQPGDATPVPFSEMTQSKPALEKRGLGVTPAYQQIADAFPPMPQICCWMTHTHADAHALIRDNLDLAPMYNGQIETAGPRYCPSIEDKVVRFADKTSHHVFLEPESLETDEVYCNGISTSLPAEVQDRLIRSLPGCENAVVLKYGYAVEYDMVRPHQIDATCETKVLPGLFTAGQINGTSGYEEAAGQGLIAGLNAARQVLGEDAVRLRRDEAYLGVMMDDLVTKVPVEPYRMFSSRAEHRLLLRSDNADQRLTQKGRLLGLVDDERWAVFEHKQQQRERILQAMRTAKHDGGRLIEYARRPEIDPAQLACLLQQTGDLSITPDDPGTHRLLASILADLHYAGYVERQRRDIERMAEQESATLPHTLDYAAVSGLRNEARLTLAKFRPTTLGQAGRLEGVNPADVMILSVHLSRVDNTSAV